MSYKVYPKPKLKKGKKWSDGHLVEYPVSCRYNGGIVIDKKWYEGVEVPDPDVPEGYELIDICIGLQLNAVPPTATKLLRKVDKV